MVTPPSDAEDPDFPSGRWVGFYQQYGSRHRTELDLAFRGGRVRGTGRDGIGSFTIRGAYDVASKEVRWNKRYQTHDVFYRGFREIKGIWGTWEIRGEARDGFHIWPAAAGEATAESIAAEAEDVVSAPFTDTGR